MHFAASQGLVMTIAAVAAVIVAVAFSPYVTFDGFIRQPDQNYDYIIVGAGTSGCVLASKLSANPRLKVLLIEAGGDAPWYSWIPLVAPVLQGGSYDWRFRTVPQKDAQGALHNRESFWPRGKMMGGSGQMNFLIHSIGSAGDFDSWQLDGWDSQSMKMTFDRMSCWMDADPVSRSFLHFQPEECTADFLQPKATKGDNSSDCGGSGRADPFFRQCPSALTKLTQVNATESPLAQAFLDAGSVLKHPVKNLNRWRIGQSSAAFMAAQNAIYRGRRWSTYQSHLIGAMKRPNLHVLSHTTVTKVIWQKDLAVGVEYITSGGKRGKIGCRKEVLLSAGSVKSPQILQLSGVGPLHVLEPLNIAVVSELPVGENLQDHLQLPLFVELNNSSASMNVAKLLQPSQLWNYISHGKGAFATSGVEGVATFNSGNGSIPTGMLILFNMGSIDADIYTSVANIKREAFNQWFPKAGSLTQEGFVLISVCLHPKSRGYIRIRSTDPSHPPEIDPKYLSHPQDVACFIDVIKEALRLMKTEAFRSLGASLHLPTFPECGAADSSSDTYLECVVRMAAITMYHPVGTNAMGQHPAHSVLDSKLRVRGVKGLRVVDASALPRLTSGTPNSVLAAMAEMAADVILHSATD